MTSSPRDKMLDEYLERDSTVSQQYRQLDANDVPADVDAAVLAKARAAVVTSSQSTQQSKRAWLRWAPSVALAASAVMVVAIVLEVGVQDEVRLPTSVTEQSTRASAPAAADSRTESKQEELQAPVLAAAPAPAAESKAATVAPESRVADAPQFASVPEAVTSLDLDARESNVALPPAPVAQKAAAPAPAAPAEDVIATASSPTPREVAAKREAEDASAADLARARTSRERAEQVVVTGNVVTPQRSRPFGPRATGAAAPAQSRAIDDGADARAEEWLVEIRRLRGEGKDAEADEQWRRFKKEFPNYSIERTDLALPRAEREAAP